MVEFPNTIAKQDLSFTNPEYDARQIELHDSLYVGGDSFKKIAGSILWKMEYEVSEPSFFSTRLAKTVYIPHVAVVDFLLSAIFVNEPEVKGPSEYWKTVNENADGNGTDLSAIAKQLTLDALLHGRSFLQIFVDENNEPRLQVVPCSLVDDWGNGWARIHTVSNERPDNVLWGKTTIERENWTFLTDNAIAQYEYIKGQETPDARLIDIQGHEFGICPIIQLIPSHKGMHVLGRIEPLLIQLYNQESALQFGLQQACFAMPVLSVAEGKEINKIFASEVRALKLTVGETFSYATPDTKIFDTAMADLERLRTELARCVHGLALEIAAKTQAPRQGAFAAQIQRSPLEALLASYAASTIDVLEKAFEAIAMFRNENPDSVELSGMDKFNGDLEQLQNAIGQNPSPKSIGDSSETPDAE